MAATAQKYSLKWNDFTVNVASTFRDLHSRHDFVDVTLACSDGSTLEAHKVILSSVSTYFRDILKSAECKHPIIILKDTGRDEAAAMLEFAYTGEVNVAQDLLPSLLHTARAFRIKGLDKVESPVEAPPPPIENAAGAATAAAVAAAAAAAAAAAVRQNSTESPWGAQSSAPNTRPHSPSSIHSDVKPPFVSAEHFMATSETKPLVQPPAAHSNPASHLPAAAVAAANVAAFPLQGGVKRGRERELSPPPTLSSVSGSHPPTRESSPCPQSAAAAAASARTPPPKRWKKSFDMAQPTLTNGQSKENGEHLIAENYSSRPEAADFEERKSNFASPSPTVSGPGRSHPYPHSMPTSPTMFERGNETRLAGLFRHHLANSDGNRCEALPSQQQALVQPQQRPESSTQAVHHSNGSADYDPVDYRMPSTDRSGRGDSASNGRDEAEERFRRAALAGYRPDSAPTVLDMSPEASLHGPPAPETARNDGDEHEGAAVHEDDLNDCVGKALSCTPDAMGRYSCDECGKIFKHPGSLQHHRHIHRGTHRCPSCGKAFSRRWDMERHLNKSKYGCPANRFSTGSAGSSIASSGSSGSSSAVQVAPTPPGPASLVAAAAAVANGHVGGAVSAPATPTVVVSAAPSAIAVAAAARMELFANAATGINNPTA